MYNATPSLQHTFDLYGKLNEKKDKESSFKGKHWVYCNENLKLLKVLGNMHSMMAAHTVPF